MKLLLDFFPVVLFFVAYKLYDIYIATAVVIAATLVQVAVTWLKYRKVEAMQWITLGLVLVMGGATIYLRDEQFIKWKLSIIEWLFGLAFLGSQFFGKQPFVQRMMGANLDLSNHIWRNLNLTWAMFFIFVGCLNLYVMHAFTTDEWMSFKTFVVPGMMVVFIVLQMVVLYKYLPQEEK